MVVERGVMVGVYCELIVNVSVDCNLKDINFSH